MDLELKDVAVLFTPKSCRTHNGMAKSNKLKNKMLKKEKDLLLLPLTVYNCVTALVQVVVQYVLPYTEIE